MKVSEIVNGENFKSLADVIVDVDTISQTRNFDRANIVFCKTDLLGSLFSELVDFDGGELTLITHLSDYPITEALFNSRPKCIKKWFAQNADHQHEDLIPIPIGIENHCGPSKGTCIDQSFIENELDDLTEYAKSGAIYVNFADTHSDRRIKREILRENPKAEFSRSKPYSEYFKDLARRKYVASPRGNGIDCHRTWEALLVRSIPVVDKHFMYDEWKIPVIQVTDWNNLELQIPKNCSTDALYMSYWRNKICG